MRWADVYVPLVPISARISPGDQPRRPVGDDEQRVGLALDAMGRRLRSPRLPGVDVPGVDASMSPISPGALSPVSPGGAALDAGPAAVRVFLWDRRRRVIVPISARI